MSVCSGFAPIEPESAHLLILGTMPSVESLNQAFYYAHPRNAFWPIMAELLNRPLQTVEQKTQALQQAGILLWDVLAACQREGSLDSAIQSPQANDFTWIFKKHPHLKTVVFNGKSAEALFKRHVLKQQDLPKDLTFLSLPSTSPANARLSLQDKCLLWQEKLADLV
ncbi:DNA-deoxyinosine glycosylase [Thiomicrorhabdus sp. zzn3]|uniref:DNA-deoxyinosine glycosylase n=1 Tax=Thiomicrorhabdus sp. zzn3 TaxID=3039775 RepID=UPI00243738D8|nr:DNA-deoxyinosine glycosylase [Thiomicrorhabdus sp. zzn3]MDG6777942.1 DNA-deoxyinosine glycosylase [Thiomicrorhabdus sp. zzn3]